LQKRYKEKEEKEWRKRPEGEESYRGETKKGSRGA